MSETSYQWDARAYERSSAAQQAWARELIDRLAPRGDERILDIGCGDGKVTAELAARVPGGSVLGIDSSEDMIRLARERFPAERHPNLSFAREDMRRLDHGGAFDLAFSNAALHWVLDHVSVLEGTRRSLRRGGRLLFQMGGQGNAEDVWRIVEATIARPAWAAYFSGMSFPYGMYGIEQYQAWMDRAGLNWVRIELLPRDMVQDGAGGLAGWIRTTWLPYTQRVPEALREQFIAEIVDEYVRAHPPDGEGLVHVRMMRLEVEAVKTH